MDTGVDIPEVVNLVFFKKVLSKIKFWQMIGRGTRLCENLKVISPSKSYFERVTNDKDRQLYNSKQGFLIFDICNVFPYFKQNPDGRTDRSDASLSLYQKIFVEKVALYKVMLSHYGKLTIEDKKFFEELRDSLIVEIKNLNQNYIGVQRALKYVHKYSELSTWANFTQTEFAEIKKYIAPNISGEIDLESARSFDYLCYRFASTKFYSSNDFMKVAKSIYKIGSYLITFKSHINEVYQHKQTLEYITSETFINDSTITRVDEVRKEIRELIRFIDPSAFEPLITDFKDQISSFDDADETPVDLRITIDDFKTLEEKVKFYIESHPEEPLIKEVTMMVKPTEESIVKFKNEVIRIAKTADEYNSIFSEDNSLVVFIRKNIPFNPKVVSEFLEHLKTLGFNEEQIAYAKELLIFISQNGQFTRQDLLREELNFGGLFNNIQINTLLKEIESRI